MRAPSRSAPLLLPPPSLPRWLSPGADAPPYPCASPLQPRSQPSGTPTSPGRRSRSTSSRACCRPRRSARPRAGRCSPRSSTSSAGTTSGGSRSSSPAGPSRSSCTWCVCWLPLSSRAPRPLERRRLVLALSHLKLTQPLRLSRDARTLSPLRQAPTPDFLHPAASSRSSAADDGASPLARSAVLAFSGFVLPAGLSPVHWSAAASSPHDAARRAFDRPDGALGWARVVVSDAGKAQFQGSFVVDGQTWHVQRQPTYAAHEAHVAAEANAAAADPTARRVVARRSAQLPASDPDALVFFRDADVARPAGGGCAHDGLAYNANPAHPVHVEGARRRRPADSNPWWAERLAGDGLFDEDGAGVSFGREQDRWLAKRQDAGGSLGSDLKCARLQSALSYAYGDR